LFKQRVKIQVYGDEPSYVGVWWKERKGPALGRNSQNVYNTVY
jgi:hypothetical protein